jgi:ribosomal-protein-alanine acetyltransferase
LKNENSLILGARCQDRTVGFLAARLTQSGRTVNQPAEYEDADILNFGVSHKFQKQGIGSLLLENFLHKTARLYLKAVWLEVRESNLNAINFYKKRGFTEIQIRKDFYRQPSESAILMKFGLPAVLPI